jgi:hypothetical protein
MHDIATTAAIAAAVLHTTGLRVARPDPSDRSTVTTLGGTP